MDADGAARRAGWVAPARDPVFAAGYLARDGLSLGAAPMPVPDDMSGTAPGPGLAAALAGLDPGRLHRGQLAEVLLGQQRMAAFTLAGLLEAVWHWACTPVVDGATVVRHDEPHRYAAKELAPLMGATLYHAEQMLSLSRLAVHTAPVLLAALRAGRLDQAKLAVIAAELKAITDEHTVRAVIDAVDEELDTHTTRTLAEHIRRILADLDPDSLRTSRHKGLDARRVVRRDSPGGLSRLVLGHGDAADVTAAFEHVDAIAHASAAGGDPHGRSLDQLRFDIALQLLRGVDPAAAGQPRPARRQGVINLTVGLSTLAGLDDGHALLAGYGPVTAAIARHSAAQFAAGCQWRYQVHDDTDGDAPLLADGTLPHGAIADLLTQLRAHTTGRGVHPVDRSAGTHGRAHRDPTAAQKAFVRARDRHCQFPACRIPARRCDIDHTIAWVDGGKTIVSNLYAVCRAHHRFKHLYGLSYEPAVGGIVWNLPGRRRYLKRHHPPPGLGVTADLTGYTHTGGPPPHLRH